MVKKKIRNGKTIYYGDDLLVFLVQAVKSGPIIGRICALSLLGGLFFAFLFVLLIIFVFCNITYTTVTGNGVFFTKETPQECLNCEGDSKESYNSKKSFKKITYFVPDSFKRKEKCSCYREYYYQKDNISCVFKVKYEGQDKSENSIDGARWFLGNYDDIKEVIINNNKWYTYTREVFSKDDETSYKKYQYVSFYDGGVYSLKYKISDSSLGDYGDNNLCYVSYDKIISSVRFK